MIDELPVGVGSPIKDFISSFLGEAEAALKERGYTSCSEQEAHSKIVLHATEVQEASGGFKIHIFNLSGKKADTQTHTMTIYAKRIDEQVEQLKKDAEIAQLSGKLEEGKRIETEERKKNKNLDGNGGFGFV